jgi:hypothetical protein
MLATIQIRLLCLPVCHPKITVHKTVTLPVVFVGVRLSLSFEGKNSVLRTKFEHRRKAVTGGWRKWHSEELRSLCSLSNGMMITSRRMRWAGHVTSVGGNISVKNILLRKHESRKSLEDLHIDERQY